jgi:hypothetical protein
MAMRRYRFGRIAALIALGYLAVVAVLGAFALSTGQGDLLWKVVTRESGRAWFLGPSEGTFTVPWGLTVVLVLTGVIQAWALWQVLRGRVRGELTNRGRAVGLLRLALYLGIGYSLVSIAGAPLVYAWKIYWVWSATGIASGCVQLAIVWLFFLVLRGTVSRGLRLFSLVVGIIAVVSGLGQEIADLLDLHSAEQILSLAGGFGYVWLAWSVSSARSSSPMRRSLRLRWKRMRLRPCCTSRMLARATASWFSTWSSNASRLAVTVYLSR